MSFLRVAWFTREFVSPSPMMHVLILSITIVILKPKVRTTNTSMRHKGIAGSVWDSATIGPGRQAARVTRR